MNDFRVRAISAGQKNHFFGYYDVNPYSEDGKYHLALETDFQDHRPAFGESANVGLARTDGAGFIKLADTRAFNFQQGAMMNWLRADGREVFCYNDLTGGALETILMDARGARLKAHKGAVSGVAEGLPLAASLNYLRNFRCRAVVGYDAGQTGRPDKPIDAEDGLFTLNLETGERKLIVSMDRLFRALPAKETGAGWMWFDHTTFNPSGTRILFFVRICRADGKGWYSSLWTVGADGRDLRNQLDYTHFISHYDWLDDETILISADVNGEKGFYLFHDGKGDFARFHADALPQDGHACFSPDRKWLICDTYPAREDGKCDLFLLRLRDGQKYMIGRYFAPPPYRGDIRCDLHPRWNRDGSRFSFDSVHEAYRQIYEGAL